MKAYQPLLGIAAPPRRASRFEDRGYGTTETPGQRAIRLARERAAHERRKGQSVVPGVRLRRMP